MAFPLSARSWNRPWLCLALLPTLLGCEVVVRATLAGVQSESRSEQASTPVPFEKAPWVEHGRIAAPDLLVQREGTLEVRFVRDRGLPIMGLLLSVDGVLVGEFWEGEALALWLSPGHHAVLCQRRVRPDKTFPLQPAAWQEPGHSSLLELEAAPGGRPCVRMALIGDRPKLIRLDSPS